MVPRGGRYDLCTGPLSSLSGCRCGAVRQAAPWPTALPLYHHRLPAAHVSLRVPEPRPPSCGETPDGGHGSHWQWEPRYRPCVKGQSDDSQQPPEKKDAGLQQVNAGLLQRLEAEQGQVIVHQVAAAEVDARWSFVGSKRQPRWWWHAIEHHTGQGLASVFGTREDETFLPLQER
jgi:hypothetical protein